MILTLSSEKQRGKKRLKHLCIYLRLLKNSILTSNNLFGKVFFPVLLFHNIHKLHLLT